MSMMQSWDILPDRPLRSAGSVSAEFLGRGITSYRDAAHYLQELPYGRNSNRSGWHLTLSERCGTCSTKHALLAELAREQGLPITLTLGIYEMNEHNTPGVGTVLEKYGLSSLPEAHCYLTYQGLRVDVTRSGVESSEPIEEFLYEESISPDQIGSYKVELHQRFVRQWVAKANKRGWEEIWRIREECIAALRE
jgi:hypothetical protein